MFYLSFSNDCVNEVGIAIKLILDDIVEHFQEEKDQMVVRRIGEQKPRSAESFQKVQKLTGCHHGHRFDVRRYIA